MRLSEPRLRRFPRRDRDVQNFVQDETFNIRDKTLQLPRRWPRP